MTINFVDFIQHPTVVLRKYRMLQEGNELLHLVNACLCLLGIQCNERTVYEEWGRIFISFLCHRSC